MQNEIVDHMNKGVRTLEIGDRKRYYNLANKVERH